MKNTQSVSQSHLKVIKFLHYYIVESSFSWHLYNSQKNWAIWRFPWVSCSHIYVFFHFYCHHTTTIYQRPLKTQVKKLVLPSAPYCSGLWQLRRAMLSLCSNFIFPFITQCEAEYKDVQTDCVLQSCLRGFVPSNCSAYWVTLPALQLLQQILCNSLLPCLCLHQSRTYSIFMYYAHTIVLIMFFFGEWNAVCGQQKSESMCKDITAVRMQWLDLYLLSPFIFLHPVGLIGLIWVVRKS